MEYRFLGNSGLKVSVISLGNWLNNAENNEKSQQLMTDSVVKAWQLGINFFDTAEGYGFGIGESQLGVALKALGVDREKYVISTKVWFSQFPGTPNSENAIGTSTKRVRQMIKNALKRLQLDYVDILFAHRRDNDAPIEEICRAFHNVIEEGLAFYWGTSEWTAAEIVEAIQVCERLNLHKPVTEQPQYSMLVRDKFEEEYGIVFDKYKYGSTVWSPLCQGILTGKYNKELPSSARLTNPDTPAMLKDTFNKLFAPENKEQTLKKFQEIENIAKTLGATMAQVALAWVINNKNVSTAITGCSRPEQLEDSVQAVQVYKKFTPEIEKQLETILSNAPKTSFDYKKWTPSSNRRAKVVLY